MARLQRIRNHGALLIAIVGLAMLAFILGDFLNSGSSFFNRSRENVGVIEGQKIHYTEYEAAKDQLTEVYKIESGRSDFDEDTHAQIRNQVWNMFMMDYTLRAQAEKITTLFLLSFTYIFSTIFMWGDIYAIWIRNY